MDKNILVNKVDVAYRELQNLDYQYMIMKSILKNFNEKQLKAILKGCKMAKKLEIQEEKLI
jgi:phage pi2 protein 07